MLGIVLVENYDIINMEDPHQAGHHIWVARVTPKSEVERDFFGEPSKDNPINNPKENIMVVR
jgi:hypothetical protein